MQNKKIKKNIRNQIQKPNFKAFKLQRFIDRKKNLILKNNQTNFVKNQKKIYVSYL